MHQVNKIEGFYYSKINDKAFKLKINFIDYDLYISKIYLKKLIYFNTYILVKYRLISF